MNSNKVHKIKIIDFNKELSDGHPIFQDFVDIIDQEDFKFIGVTELDDVLFVRLHDHTLDKLINALTKYFDIVVTNVTNSVLNGDLQIEFPDIEILTPNIFNNFRKEVLDINDVLDKILLKGVNSLDELELCVLKKISS